MLLEHGFRHKNLYFMSFICLCGRRVDSVSVIRKRDDGIHSMFLNTKVQSKC